MKKSFIIILAGVLSLAFVGSATAFDLGGFLNEVEKQTRPPRKKQNPPANTRQPDSSGGLIGLGKNLGLFDKKTSDLLSQGAKTFQAFQPIGLDEEKAIGASLAARVFDRYGGPYNNPGLLRYVNLVGQAVAEMSDRTEIEYHFAIINTNEPNAFATPGGYVFVSIGLLRLLENEAQLAGVLGHEIAHITHQHALKTIQRGRRLQGISALGLAAFNENPDKFGRLIDGISDIIFTRGLDKDLEFEADKMGVDYAARVGYNPSGLRDFIRRLGKKTHSGSIFFSTHPPARERYDRLSRLAAGYRSAAGNPMLAERFRRETKGRL
ncbi:MAG: M48 family metalloprotease [Nitrospinales bacterium]